MATTIDAVKVVKDTDLTDARITSLIAMANRMVTALFSGVTIDADVLTDIETWVVAHYIAIGPERQAKIDEIGPAKTEYMGKGTGIGFESTTYGMQALALDYTGTLKAKSGKKAVSIYIVPTEEETS